MIRTPLKMVKYFYYSGSNRLYYHVFKSPLGFYSSSSFPLSFDLRFYQNLFDEKIGFSKLAEFYSYPDLAFLIKNAITLAQVIIHTKKKEHLVFG